MFLRKKKVSHVKVRHEFVHIISWNYSDK